MSDEWKPFLMPSKYFKFREPGDELAGKVKEIRQGKFGTEVLFELPSGVTTLTCASAQLKAWSEHARAGQTWRITFVLQEEGRDGHQGRKVFEFRIQASAVAADPGHDANLDEQSPFSAKR